VKSSRSRKNLCVLRAIGAKRTLVLASDGDSGEKWLFRISPAAFYLLAACGMLQQDFCRLGYMCERNIQFAEIRRNTDELKKAFQNLERIF
jgi:hypothetical protein